MLKRFRFSTLAPITLAIASIILLLRINFGTVIFFLPSNVDILVLLLGLGLATTMSLSFIVQEFMRHLRETSVEQARTEAFEEHRRFLKRLDHELKNPLTALRAGLASLALINQADQHNKLITILDNQTLRLSQLITNLRKLAEIDSLPIEIYPLEITQFIQAIVDLHNPYLEVQDRSFSMTVPDTTDTYPILYGDQDLLLLAVHNLLENAFKYTNSSDHISLEIKISHNGYLTICVSNTGMGILSDDLPYVWEELYRGSDVSHISGNGIGLALVRKIIDQHDGEATIESIPNKITTVTLSIPLN